MTPERLQEIRAEIAALLILKDTTALTELLDAYSRILHEVEYLRSENAHLLRLLPPEAFPIYTSRYARERASGSREAYPRTEKSGA